MKKIYADSSLNVSQGDFSKPLSDISLDFDCDKYEENSTNNATDIEEEDEF